MPGGGSLGGGGGPLGSGVGLRGGGGIVGGGIFEEDGFAGSLFFAAGAGLHTLGGSLYTGGGGALPVCAPAGGGPGGFLVGTWPADPFGTYAAFLVGGTVLGRLGSPGRKSLGLLPPRPPDPPDEALEDDGVPGCLPLGD